MPRLQMAGGSWSISVCVPRRGGRTGECESRPCKPSRMSVKAACRTPQAGPLLRPVVGDLLAAGFAVEAAVAAELPVSGSVVEAAVAGELPTSGSAVEAAAGQLLWLVAEQLLAADSAVEAAVAGELPVSGSAV